MATELKRQLVQDATTKTVADSNATKIGRITGTLTFWSANQALVTLPATGAAASQPLPNVVIPTAANGGIPTGATVLSVFGIMIFGTRHNSNALANKTTGDQNLQVRVNGAGAFVTFHVVPDDSLVTTLGGASPLGDGAGGVFMGSVDVKAEVTANGTYNFQWTTAGVDVAALLLYDVQVGLIVTYSL